MSKEEQDFIEFMAKLEHKVCETQNDFNKLSDNNKAKVMAEIKRMIESKGFIEALNYFSNGMENYRKY